jgi:hypothetical protein
VKPPPGVTDAQWRKARTRAANAEIERLTKNTPHGGFYPHKIREAFKNGWCDASGNVADYLDVRA